MKRIVMFVLLFFVLLLLFVSVAFAQAPNEQPPPLSAQMTVGQFLIWLLTGGTIAVLLNQYVPGFQTWQSPLKGWVVVLLNQMAPYVLDALKANPTISGFWEQRLADVVFGLIMLAIAGLVHIVHEWLAARKKAAIEQLKNVLPVGVPLKL